MAKTHLSLSADPTLLNAPEDFTLQVRDIRAYTGAGWLVPLCGDIQQMPGLGKTPAALNVDIDDDGPHRRAVLRSLRPGSWRWRQASFTELLDQLAARTPAPGGGAGGGARRRDRGGADRDGGGVRRNAQTGGTRSQRRAHPGARRDAPRASARARRRGRSASTPRCSQATDPAARSQALSAAADPPLQIATAAAEIAELASRDRGRAGQRAAARRRHLRRGARRGRHPGRRAARRAEPEPTPGRPAPQRGTRAESAS